MLRMPPHIDKFKIRHSHNDVVFIERIDGEAALQLEADREQVGFPLPYFSEYVIITKVHEDGECHQQIDGSVKIVYELPLPPSTEGLANPLTQ